MLNIENSFESEITRFYPAASAQASEQNQRFDW